MKSLRLGMPCDEGSELKDLIAACFNCGVGVRIQFIVLQTQGYAVFLRR